MQDFEDIVEIAKSLYKYSLREQRVSKPTAAQEHTEVVEMIVGLQESIHKRVRNHGLFTGIIEAAIDRRLNAINKKDGKGKTLKEVHKAVQNSTFSIKKYVSQILVGDSKENNVFLALDSV